MTRGRRSRRPEALEQFRQARALAARGERERAVESYRRALEADPSFAEAWVNLGVLYEQMGPGYADEGLRCLRRGTELNPDSARGHYNLGVALSKRRGQLDEAIEAFETAIAIDPAHRNALYALALQWNRKGDPVKAAAYHRWYQEALGQRAPGPGRAPEPPAPERAPLRLVPRPTSPRPRLRIRFVR